MRPVFCGNFEYETRHSDLERLFSKYGRVDRVDIKSGFAFIYFDDERDAEDAIHGLANRPFGYSRRRLSVEWARQGDRGPRFRDGSKSVANTKPTKTLFVINFDPINTRIRDIERHFEPYGNVMNVRIRRNFAFVQFETQEEATKALECTNMSSSCFLFRSASASATSTSCFFLATTTDGSGVWDLPLLLRLHSVCLCLLLLLLCNNHQWLRCLGSIAILLLDLVCFFVSSPQQLLLPLASRVRGLLLSSSSSYSSSSIFDNISYRDQLLRWGWAKPIKILDRVVSVEYALRDDGERDRRDSPGRSYGRRGSPYGRSPSPVYRRSRPSPDYGRAQSPIYERNSGVAYDRSPEYGRFRSRSPVGRTPSRRSRS